jgi:hypothetical protein
MVVVRLDLLAQLTPTRPPPTTVISTVSTRYCMKNSKDVCCEIITFAVSKI